MYVVNIVNYNVVATITLSRLEHEQVHLSVTFLTHYKSAPPINDHTLIMYN